MTIAAGARPRNGTPPTRGALEAAADAYLRFGEAFVAARSASQDRALVGPLPGALARLLPELGVEGSDVLDGLRAATAHVDARRARFEHERLFVAAPVAVPLDVGAYIDADRPGRAERDAHAFLARYGLAPASSLRGRADHLPLLLECIGLLALGAAEHERDGGVAARDAMLHDAAALHATLVRPALPALVRRCRREAADRGLSQLYPWLAEALLRVAQRPLG